MSTPDGRPALPYVHVADVLVLDQAAGTVLLVHRSDGTWWFPGGRVEEGEGLTSAVAREALEETGYEIDVLGAIALTEEIESGRHVLFATFRGVVRSGVLQAPVDDGKIVDVCWVSLEEATAELSDLAVPLEDLLARVPLPLTEVRAS